MSIPSLAAVITAAGSSSRFSNGLEQPVKKEYLSIDGHTVLYRAAVPFFEIPTLSAVIITCPEGSEDETAVALEDLIDINTIPVLIVPGGQNRKESVSKALDVLSQLPCSYEYIAVHDGARPFLTSRLVIKTLASAALSGASVPATLISDAVRRLGSDGLISEIIPKRGLVTVQTPQIFTAGNLLLAYQIYQEDDADDDLEVYSAAGFPCSFNPGDPANKKITYLEDIPDAKEQVKAYLEARDKGRRSGAAIRRMRQLSSMREEEE